MVSNRTHAETLVQCLDDYIYAALRYDNNRAATRAPADRARAMLVAAIEMTLNDLVEAEGDDPR